MWALRLKLAQQQKAQRPLPCSVIRFSVHCKAD